MGDFTSLSNVCPETVATIDRHGRAFDTIKADRRRAAIVVDTEGRVGLVALFPLTASVVQLAHFVVAFHDVLRTSVSAR